MNTFHTIRHGAIAFVFVLVAVLGVTGAAVAAQGDAAVDREVSEQCTSFHYDGGPPYIDEACAAEAEDAFRRQTDDAVIRLCSYYDPHPVLSIDEACALAVRAATEEAAGWSDYDSIAIGQEAHQVELAKQEAAEEAAGWTDFDSTAIGPA